MPAQVFLSVHSRRTRTRSTAFVLAVTLFVGLKLIALGAANVSRADDIEGLQILDVDCGSEHAVSC